MGAASRFIGIMKVGANYILVSVFSALVGITGTLIVVDLERRGRESGTDKEPPPAIQLDGVGIDRVSGKRERTITDPRISFRQLGNIAEELALADPEMAVRKALEIPGHDNREAYLGSVLRTWGEIDGETAAIWVSNYFKGEQLTDALYYVADGWAEGDPEKAGAWYKANTEGTVLDDALWEVLESWGRKNPSAAFAWSENLDEYEKATAMQGLAEGWGAVDPEEAVEAGMTMDMGSYGMEFLSSVMTQWAGSDPEKAAAWATQLDNEQLRAEVLSELGETWAQTDPVRAAEWAGSIEDAVSRWFAQEGIAIGWSEHDPGAAVEWGISNITEADQLDEMVGDITFNWVNQDPRGAVKWLERQPPGPRTDLVLNAFTSEIFDDDPEASVLWAAQINDPALRDQKVRNLLEEWVGSYGTPARVRIQAMNLPETLKAEFTVPGN